ncbi:MAG TPA: hypothetical protein VD905_01405 [Flavobacteriales bacterium]|nr:hypothetical protein [Flavobacteriales bacterium]
MLKQQFYSLANHYTLQEKIIDALWHELETSYSHKKRHYHNLSHLENLLVQLEPVKSQTSNWDAILFAVFYHDAVYRAMRTDNELQSARLAENRLHELNVPEQTVRQVFDLIMATKGHTIRENNDINLFTDADLSILGTDWNAYHTYAQQIRGEYSLYPDFVYNPGRKKVLDHFLSMPRIFKTNHFFEKYEKQARENLKKERASL